MTFEFTYDSDHLAEVLGINVCPRITVTVDYVLFKTHNYDTPHGPSPDVWQVGAQVIVDLYSDQMANLMNLKDNDDEFLTELVDQLTRKEEKMIEHGLKMEF